MLASISLARGERSYETRRKREEQERLTTWHVVSNLREDSLKYREIDS